ncbi:MAG: hypothetical protein Q8Q17_02800 [bacterium]|nr:hypothetical protein [bacterium]
MNTKNIVLLAIVIIIVALAAWYIVGKKAAPTSSTAGQGLGADIYEQAVPNAAEKLPETNPFKAESNPFKAVQTNPFGE